MGWDQGIAERIRAKLAAFGMGYPVVEVAGWQTRGSTSFNPRGSVDHHTGGSMIGTAPSLGICIYGRSDLPGPLCNVLIGRDNTIYVIAAGRANHAGEGGWAGLVGNSSVYGVERENAGYASIEPWRDDQTELAALVHAALIEGRSRPGLVCRHQEWTSRKIDTHSIDGDYLRARVAHYLTSGGSMELTGDQAKWLWEIYTAVRRRDYDGDGTLDTGYLMDAVVGIGRQIDPRGEGTLRDFLISRLNDIERKIDRLAVPAPAPVDVDALAAALAARLGSGSPETDQKIGQLADGLAALADALRS